MSSGHGTLLNNLWQALRDRSREAYDARKDEVAQEVAELLDARVPGLKQATEAVDVATPVAYQRYTSNGQGSTEGGIPRPGTVRVDEGDLLPHTLPGLVRFTTTGQSDSPGGGMPVAGNGRKVIQRICRADRRGFKMRK